MPPVLDSVCGRKRRDCAGIIRMNLRRGLRRESHSRTRLDDDGLLEDVTAKDARSRGRENQVDGVAVRQHAANPKRRLGVRMQQDRALAAAPKRQFEPAATPDVGSCPIVSG
jgi:hypothetical protein